MWQQGMAFYCFVFLVFFFLSVAFVNFFFFFKHFHKILYFLHSFQRNEEGEFTGKTSQYSHTVIVYDEAIRNYVRNNLQRYDKVFIEGYLNYQKCKTDGGSNLMSGNIVALHIERA